MAPNSPSVSVIIPVRRKLELLSRALNSCLYQTSVPSEIILIDDSTDIDDKEKMNRIATDFLNLATATEIPTSIILKESGGLGAAAARNMGVECSKGDYLAFLDADDFFLPDKLNIQISAMIQVDADFSHTNYIAMTNSHSTKVVSTALNKGYGQAKEISYGRCLIATPTVIICGKFGREFGELFPSGISVGEDQIAWARISHTSKKPILHLNVALSVVAVDWNSSSQSYANIKQAKIDLLKNAKSIGIIQPKLYDLSKFLSIVYRKLPKKGKLFRALRAAIQEIVTSN